MSKKNVELPVSSKDPLGPSGPESKMRPVTMAVCFSSRIRNIKKIEKGGSSSLPDGVNHVLSLGNMPLKAALFSRAQRTTDVLHTVSTWTQAME